jgi:hypothetical protein
MNEQKTARTLKWWHWGLLFVAWYIVALTATVIAAHHTIFALLIFGMVAFAAAAACLMMTLIRFVKMLFSLKGRR